LVAGQGFDYLCALGEYAETMVQAARQAGMPAQHSRTFSDQTEAAAFLQQLLAAGALRPGDLILVKGSRGMRMEKVIAALMA
jgi:UDP-N-acetylmuramoyl-tripeptide--D-alanyl-D-alanine ligase